MLQELQKTSPDHSNSSCHFLTALSGLKCSSRLCHYLVLVIIAVLTALPSNHILPLLDRDEPRFAQAAREMIERDEWFVPYFNGEYRFDKPVMSYWLMRASIGLFGDNEFAVRFGSVVCTLTIAFLIYEFTRRHFSNRAGLLAGTGWLTCFQVLLHGKLAVADMPMVLSVTLSHIAIYKLLIEPAEKPGNWFWVLYVGLAFGFLSKGPIALLCPFTTLVLYRFVFWRKPVAWKALHVLLGSVVFLILVAVWAIPALSKTEGLFWQVGMQEHVVQRGIKPLNGRQFKLFYYLATAFLSLFPWIAFAATGWVYLRKHWTATTAFLTSWLAGPYIIFSFYATQLPHYVLPAFPAALIILGVAIEHYSNTEKLPKSWFFWGFTCFAATLLWLIADIAQNEEYNEDTLPLKTVAFALVGIFSGMLLTAIMVKNRCLAAAAASVLIISVSFVYLGKSLRELSIAAQLQPLFHNMPAKTEHYFHGFEEPSLVYYSDAHWQNGPISPELINQSGPKLFLTLTKEIWLEDFLAKQFPGLFKKKQRPDTRLPDQIYSTLIADGYHYKPLHGLNLARISWVETEVWYKP